MQDTIIQFLKDKGVSEDILNQIIPQLENVTNNEQLTAVLSQFQSVLPDGLLDNLPTFPNLDVDSLADQAKDFLGGLFGGK